MRTAFVETLTELAARDERIMLLVGDLGFGVVVEYAKRFPKQFLNVGIAEQNMAGVAAGLALSGKIVFTYSIANFPILRCLEQIRNDICYPRANVISVSVGGGFCYGALGMSHHATEDIAVMRALPELTVLSPGDPVETRAVTRWLGEGRGPAYLRLGRAGEPVVHQRPIDWQCGKAIEVVPGDDVTFIATGSMLKTAVSTAEKLKKSRSVSVRVLSMPTIKPIDVEAILEAARKTTWIVTLEEHSIIGGLGGAVAEILAETPNASATLIRCGLKSEFCEEIGDQEHLLKHHRLDADSLATDLAARFDG